MKKLSEKNIWDLSLPYVQVILLLIATTIIMLKFYAWNYSFDKLIPEVTYELKIRIEYENTGDPLRISTFLPLSDNRQTVLEEILEKGNLRFESKYTDHGREILWYDNSFEPKKGQILYTAEAILKKTVYKIPDDIILGEKYPQNFQKYIESTATIQVNHPTIASLYDELVAEEDTPPQIIASIFSYVNSLESIPFKGLTDAVTTARLKEASCNGKSRLFIALTRRAGIPSRLVGGIILNAGSKKTSHQWLELYLNGFWVPFDPLNGHYAIIPSNYLTLYYGDKFLFSHSPDIVFDYNFNIRKNLAIGENFQEELNLQPFNSYAVWQVFENLGLPLSLLQIIIMIPLGAFVITIFRNVIGLETFGTFLPALIAAASRQTGMLWGLIGFLLIVLVVALIHYPLDRWRILHNPKMSILMIVVVNVLLLFSVIGHRAGLNDLSFVSLFPIAVLTITSERFSQMIVENGIRKATKVMGMTLIVIAAAYLAMNSLAMQSLFLALPELFLILIVLNMWLGRWIGLRLIEFWRFRWLLEK